MTAARLALAAALLLPAACGSWNPLVVMGIVHQPAHKPTPLTPISATVTPRAEWTVQVGRGGPFSFRPDVVEGRIYVAAADGTLTVVEQATGRVVARAETKKPLSGGVEFAEGRIIAGTTKGEVLAVDASGKPAWSTTLGGEVIAPPAVSGKTVVVRTADGRIFALSAEDGRRRWVFQRPTPALLLRSEAGVLTRGKDIVAGYPNGKLIALDLEDGKLIWEVNVSLPRGATELERIADVAGLPVIEGGTVCAGAYQGKVACFDIESRNLLWARDLSTSRTLARDARSVYVVDDASAVHALDKGSGASLWKQDKLLHRKLTAPFIHDGKVVVGDVEGFIHVLSPDDGALIGRLATDGSRVQSIVPAEKGFLVLTEKGSLSLVR